jgi:hypothetical protein
VGAQADRIAGELTAHVEKAAKALILAICANLIAATPVATGWARANWVPSIGSPIAAAAGSPAAVSTSQQEAGQAAVLSFRLAQGTLYVSNNVPYIGVLNYGRSAQAPAGFIERAVEQALVEIQRDHGVDFGIESFRAEAGARGVQRAFHALHRGAA